MNQLDKYSALAAKYLAGQTDPAEEKDLFAWTASNSEHQATFDAWAAVWGMTKGAATSSQFETDMDAAWRKIDAATATQGGVIMERQTAKVIVLSKMVRRWSVAAVILLAIGAGLWWFSNGANSHQLVEVQTFDNEKKAITLPDSSRVWLNENSRLVYDAQFEQRHVTMEGEAFFEVERLVERPFEIISGNATTTVLGTSFNVRAYANEDKIEVTVKTGKVAFANMKHKDKPTYLSPGETGVFDKKISKIEVAALEQENADAWKTSKLTFDDEKLSGVIAALARYFNVKIEVANPALLNCPYTSTFEQPDLEAILTVIGSTIGFEFSQSDGRYVLTGKGCQ